VIGRLELRGTGLGKSMTSPQWWPTLAGIAFAGFVALDLFRGREHGGDLAPIVAASGLVYLAAAATRKPTAAWWMFFASVLVIAAAKIGWVDVDATWILLALAGLLVAYRLLHPTPHAVGGLRLQTIAMIAFGAVAVAALSVNQVAGASLVALGLFAHAAWDVYHYRANKVVVRSMAEFCFVLDTLLAVAIIVATASD
jgi:hypothetical protein